MSDVNNFFDSHKTSCIRNLNYAVLGTNFVHSDVLEDPDHLKRDCNNVLKPKGCHLVRNKTMKAFTMSKKYQKP